MNTETQSQRRKIAQSATSQILFYSIILLSALHLRIGSYSLLLLFLLLFIEAGCTMT